MSRFSQLYVNKGSLQTDSPRMRRRLFAALDRMPSSVWTELPHILRSQLGIKLVSGNPSYVLQNFFDDAALRDVLDSVTFITEILKLTSPYSVSSFIGTVALIFNEEHVGYRVDNSGIVHFNVDEEFERARASSVEALSASRYNAAAHNLREAFKYLDTLPVNGKLAVRSIFGALEALFKLMFSRAPRLGGAELEQYLKPVLNGIYGEGTSDLRAANKLLASMRDWVEAAHFYRHEEGKEEPSQPPLALAVALISTGTGFLRWLAEVDQLILKA